MLNRPDPIVYFLFGLLTIVVGWTIGSTIGRIFWPHF